MSDKQMSLIPVKLRDVAKELNQSVSTVFSSETTEGFEKAYVVSEAIQRLSDLLTADYMKPIMALQGNKLGFKTDKDDKTGYDEKTVKNCLIEAVLTGVQPVGNHFNIIKGNCYLTKEGFGYLLKNLAGLWYEISPELPRINNNSTGAAINMNIQWKFVDGGSELRSKKLDIAVKMDSYTSTDAIIGKATRKARAWLYNTITGSEIADGDITDINNPTSKERAANLTAETEEALRKTMLTAAGKTQTS